MVGAGYPVMGGMGDTAAALRARIELMRARLPVARVSDLARELDSIRRLAVDHGLTPAMPVIRAIESALARGEHGGQIGGWLSILSDAVGCGRSDAATEAVFAAACSVRAVHTRH